MLVKVIGSSHSNTWYKKKILEVFEVFEDDERPNVYILKDSKKVIMKKDCHIIDEIYS